MDTTNTKELMFNSFMFTDSYLPGFFTRSTTIVYYKTETCFRETVLVQKYFVPPLLCFVCCYWLVDSSTSHFIIGVKRQHLAFDLIPGIQMCPPISLGDKKVP